jgi:predicted nucleotidyltransferase
MYVMPGLEPGIKTPVFVDWMAWSSLATASGTYKSFYSRYDMKCAIYFLMATKAPGDPILQRFRAAVNEIYGDRAARVVLFGSRARGDAGPDSDYDVAVFLHAMPDRFAEMNRLADLSTSLLDESGEFIHAMPYRADAYYERTPLMHEIRADGIDL